MDDLPESRLRQFVERWVVLARRTVARVSTRYRRTRLTLGHQFRELVIGCVVHNVERGFDISHRECERPEC